jgi:hypothetical protein
MTRINSLRDKLRAAFLLVALSQACNSPPGTASAVGTGGGANIPVGWTDEPAGLTKISDFGFSTPSDSGWVNLNPADLSNGHLTLTSDPTARMSPPAVVQFYYQKGNAALCGSSPATLELDLATTVTTLYIGTWAKFSSGFSFPGGTPGSEVHFLYGNPQSNAWVTIDLRQDGGVEFVGAGGTDVYSSAGLYTMGAWTKVELLMDYNANTARLWINDQAVAFSGVTPVHFAFSGGGFSKVQVSPTWGGCGSASPTVDSWIWYDHIRVSGK